MRSSLSLYLGQSYGLKIILTALLSLNGRPKPGEKSLQILAENNKGRLLYVLGLFLHQKFQDLIYVLDCLIKLLFSHLID